MSLIQFLAYQNTNGLRIDAERLYVYDIKLTKPTRDGGQIRMKD